MDIVGGYHTYKLIHAFVFSFSIFDTQKWVSYLSKYTSQPLGQDTPLGLNQTFMLTNNMKIDGSSQCKGGWIVSTKWISNDLRR